MPRRFWHAALPIAALGIGVAFTIVGARHAATDSHVIADPVPADVRALVAQEPTLARRIEMAFQADPEGWTTDGFVASWRGGAAIWVANGEEFVGNHPDYGTPSWPRGDERYDRDRAIVWAAFQLWQSTHAEAEAERINAEAFAKLGPAPATMSTPEGIWAIPPGIHSLAPQDSPSTLTCVVRLDRLCLAPGGETWELQP